MRFVVTFNMIFVILLFICCAFCEFYDFCLWFYELCVFGDFCDFLIARDFS